MDLMTKAQKTLGYSQFNPTCRTLRFRNGINPDIAKVVGFDVNNVEKLPALVIVDIADSGKFSLLLLQDVEKDGVLKHKQRDDISELFNQTKLDQVLAAHVFEDNKYETFVAAQKQMEANSLAWFAKHPNNIPVYDALGIPYA